MTHGGFLRPRRSIHDDFNVITGEFEGFDYSNPLICHGKGSGGGTNTVTNNSAPPPEIMAAYQAALGRAQTAADQPLQQYQGQTVAGFTPDQTQAFGTIANAQGTAQPYINQAANLINAGTQPLWSGVQQFSPDAISQYSNPYTQQVLNSQIALEQNQDAQQQEALKGNAISSGAWGGDRAGVAQAALAGQQALANNSTNANILNTGYNQALQEFNQQQQAQLGANEANAYLNQQGAFGMANLGQEALGTQLAGANAQLQSGLLQQQQNQAQLNVPYEQFLQRQAYPFQTAQYYANIAEGVGGNSGGTGTSTSTTPPPSTLSQVGGGLLGAGALGYLGYLALSDRRRKKDIHRIGTASGYPIYKFKYKGALGTHIGVMAQDVEKRNPDAVRNINGTKYVDYSKLAVGGRVGFSAGGVPGMSLAVPDLSESYIPSSSAVMGRGMGPPTAQATAPKAGDPVGDGENMLLSALMLGAKNNKDAPDDDEDTDSAATWQLGKESGASFGDISKAAQQSTGASQFLGPDINTLASKLQNGFGNYGGAGGLGALSFLRGAAYGGRIGFADGGSTDDGIQVSGPAPLPPSYDDLQRRFDVQNDLAEEQPDVLTAPPISAAELTPPGVPGGFGTYVPSQEVPSGQMPPPSVQDQMPAPTPSSKASNSEIREPTREEVNPWLALAAAGFGMMGGTSPYAGVNIGRGALAGLQNYAQQRQHVDSVNQAADKMMEEAKEHRDRLAIDQKNADTNAQYRQDQAAYQKGELALRSKQVEHGKWVAIKDALGNEYLVNPTTNEIRDPAGVTSGGQSGRSVANIYSPPTDTEGKPVTGDNYLQSIPPQIAALSKGYASGMMAPPTGMATRNPTVIAAWTAAQQADQNFAAHAATRYTTIQQFVNPNSKTAMTVRAQNVAMEHIQTMREAVEALNNHDVRAYNTAVNAVARQAGYAEPTNAEIGQNILGDELAKAIIAGGGALADREAFKKGLGTGASLNQALGGLNEYEKYMAGQMQGLERSYQAGTGLNDFAQRVNLSPAAQGIVAKYSHPANPNASSGAVPPPAAIEALRKDPSLASMFEKKYGVPAAGFIGGQ